MRRLLLETHSQNKNYSKVVAILVIILGCLIAGRVFVANRLVEASQTLRSLDLEIAELEAENEVLVGEVRRQESIVLVEQKAVLSGFVKTNKAVYLVPSVRVAFNKQP